MAAPSKSLNPFNNTSNNDDFDDGWDDWGDEEEEQQSLVYNKYDRSKTAAPSRPTYQAQPPRQQPSAYQAPPVEKYTNEVFTIPKYTKSILGGSLAFVLLMFMNGRKRDNDIGSNTHQKNAAQVMNSEDITHLAILGERHSGVSFLETELKACYPDAQVSSSLERVGLFFQDDPISQKHNSIVVQLVLNTYDWLEQMRNNPLYMPEHEAENGSPLPWEDFLAKEWSTERPDRDLKFKDETGPVCQMSFRYDQVISCVEIEGNKNPIYELDEFGNPFPSIQQLRTTKLMNHRATKDWETVKDHWAVKWDNLTQEYDDLLQKIDAKTGWTHVCDADKIFPAKSKTETMTLDFVEFVTESADWEIEEQFGFKKWTADHAANLGIKPSADAENGGKRNQDKNEKEKNSASSAGKKGSKKHSKKGENSKTASPKAKKSGNGASKKQNSNKGDEDTNDDEETSENKNMSDGKATDIDAVGKADKVANNEENLIDADDNEGPEKAEDNESKTENEKLADKEDSKEGSKTNDGEQGSKKVDDTKNGDEDEGNR